MKPSKYIMKPNKYIMKPNKYIMKPNKYIMKLRRNTCLNNVCVNHAFVCFFL